MKIRTRLLRAFRDFDYRHAYVNDFINASLATQIKVLREQQNLSQQQLAEKAEMLQSQISALEDVDRTTWTLRTLRRIARALDLAVVVRFESFGRVLPDIGRLERKHLERSPFTDDPEFSEFVTRDYLSETTPAPTARVLRASANFTSGSPTSIGQQLNVA